ncbi:unnamed protein product, partial [Owenia fusiformis]
NKCKCFTVNLQSGLEGPPLSNLAMKMSPIFAPDGNGGSIGLDAVVKKEWVKREDRRKQQAIAKIERFPFFRGHPFEMEIEIQKEGYVVFVDGTYILGFKHQMSIEKISHLILDGDVNFYNVHYPDLKTLPYVKEIPNGLCIGEVVCIDGYIPEYAESFQFGFQTNDHYYPDTTVAFHMKVQLQGMDRKAVCNAYINNKWQVEKFVDGYLPFVRDSKLDIKVTVWKDYFMVDVNDSFFVEYKYNVVLGDVTHVAIDGD